MIKSSIFQSKKQEIYSDPCTKCGKKKMAVLGFSAALSKKSIDKQVQREKDEMAECVKNHELTCEGV